MAKKGDNSARNTAPSDKPALRTPVHGQGKLYASGVLGNKGGGGPGRPRSEIRKLSGEAYAKLIPMLFKLATTKETKDADKIRAGDVLGRHGGISSEPPINRDLIAELAEAVESELDAADGDEIKARIYERWAVTLGRYAAGEA